MVARYASLVNEFQPLIDQRYREQVKRARAMTVEERLREGFRLTDEYMRTIAAMSAEERALWRAQIAKEEDAYFGPPIPIAEIPRAERAAR